MKAFVIDTRYCNGCRACQIACKDEHVGNDWSPYAKPQPNSGHFWGKVNEYVRGNTPHVQVNYVFVPCQHCKDAPCIDSCPDEAIFARDDGLVIIDPAKCSGCKNCVDACPYGAIYINENLNLAQKCTGCAHLLDDYGWTIPRCADNCPNEVIKFGEESDLDMNGTETLNPEFGLETRVSYLGLPTKRFVAGTVYTPDDKELVIGANCTLDGEGESYTKTTDDWGDFWFKDLPVGNFTLTIEGNGKTKTIDVSTEKDVGLGDIPLS